MHWIVANLVLLLLLFCYTRIMQQGALASRDSRPEQTPDDEITPRHTMELQRADDRAWQSRTEPSRTNRPLLQFVCVCVCVFSLRFPKVSQNNNHNNNNNNTAASLFSWAARLTHLCTYICVDIIHIHICIHSIIYICIYGSVIGSVRHVPTILRDASTPKL